MFIIAGLGNPGRQYQDNRHNIGFMVVDAIQRAHSFSPWSKKFKSEISEGTIAGEKVLLMKPQTYMNLSGDAVGEAVRFYKLAPSDVIIFHDELDLPAAKMRVKVGGGNGGHNGLKSMDAHVGRDYKRVRLGIGHPGVKEMVSNHVLGDFHKVDQEWLEPLLDDIARHVDLLFKGDGSRFMNKLAGQSPAPKAEKPAPKAQSHIRQARSPSRPAVEPSGPMAAMLKKLLGNKGE